MNAAVPSVAIKCSDRSRLLIRFADWDSLYSSAWRPTELALLLYFPMQCKCCSNDKHKNCSTTAALLFLKLPMTVVIYYRNLHIKFDGQEFPGRRVIWVTIIQKADLAYFAKHIHGHLTVSPKLLKIGWFNFFETSQEMGIPYLWLVCRIWES